MPPHAGTFFLCGAQAAGEEDDSGYTEYWAAINEALNFIGMGLRRTAYKDEDNKLYIGIVNKVADSPSKTSGTRLTPGELSLFRLIVEEITNNCPDGELPMMQVRACSPAVRTSPQERARCVRPPSHRALTRATAGHQRARTRGGGAGRRRRRRSDAVPRHAAGRGYAYKR